ncbi:THUMP domain-containing protein 1 [Ambystoma mexicanum]|uniref:THUMP domain-containing protein 1 n=1 Tax=Ambystoma mexicanum TaxID=8296 RepID=UPI0037E73733
MSGVKGQKRSRAQYGGSIKRQKGARQLEAGMQGILITCNMNERKCVGEAYSLLNAYAEELYGPEKFSEPDQPQSENDDEDDMEAALKKEVDQIRSTTERNLRRFQSVESGANNVIFIKTHSIEPEKFVHHILKDLYTTKKKKSRVILRMLPFSGTCKAFIEDMKKYAENFFEPWFKAPKKGTFQIVYKARNNGHVEREQVIKELAGIVGSLNPENKVDLGNPQYTVVVEIIKSVCCMTVVEDYIRFRKYNLQEVVKDDKKEESVKQQHEEINKETEQIHKGETREETPSGRLEGNTVEEKLPETKQLETCIEEKQEDSKPSF